jgi:hypothetical protein
MSEDETSPPLTLFAEDSPARTSATPAKGRGSAVIDRGSGTNTHESFANWNPVTSSWKTSQHSLLEDLTTFSERWPIAGTMQNGRVFARSTWAPRTSETDCSLLPTPRAIYGEHPGMLDPRHLTGAVHLWPTPSAADGTGGPGESEKRLGGLNLRTAVRLWKTPTAEDCQDRAFARNNRGEPKLSAQVKMYPTPTSSSGGSNATSPAVTERGHGTNLAAAIGGALNPTWVEWLMGFPLGWTVLEHWVTRSSRKSRKSSGE